MARLSRDGGIAGEVKQLGSSVPLPLKQLEFPRQSPSPLRGQPPLHKGAEAWRGPSMLSFLEGYQLLLFFHAAFGRYEKRRESFQLCQRVQ